METRSGFIAIVGPANAGKSTLLNQILGEKVSIVSRKQQSTRNRILGVKTFERTQCIFFDTPGFLEKSSRGEMSRFLNEALHTSVTEADIVLLVVDAAAASKTPQFVSRMKQALQSRSIETPSLVVLNKIDLIDKRKLLPMLSQLNEEFAAEASVVFLPVSAKSGDGVDRLLAELSKLLPEGPWYFPEDAVSDQSERFLAAELIREALFERLHQELPYSSAVLVRDWDEEGKKIRILADIIVEKESQKGIVIGKRGATLKAIGTAARIALEHRFRHPVFLELFVKVEEEWTRSKKGLARVGYGH